MANEIDVTVADAALREVWVTEALRALYAESVVAKPDVILIKEAKGKEKGDNVNFTQLAALSVNDVGAAGTVTNQATTHTQRQVALNRWREVTWTVVDRVAKQSAIDHEFEFNAQALEALSEDMDLSVLDDHGSFTGDNAKGSTVSPEPMNADLALEAVIELADVRKVKKKNMNLILGIRSAANLFKEDRLGSADKSGKSSGYLISGAVPTFMGIRTLEHPIVVQTGDPLVEKNLLLSKRAIGMGISSEPNFDKFRTSKANQYSTDVLYGEAVLLSTEGVTINARAAA